MKNFRKFAIILLSLVIVSFIAVFFTRPDVKYVIKSLVNGSSSSCKLTEINIDDAKYKYIPLKNLEHGRNCSFDQSLMLVNKAHPLPDGFKPNLEQYENTDAFINGCATESFIKMRENIGERFSKRLLIMSSYRNSEEQLQIYNDDTDGTAAKPGCSEHETGLGLDIYIKYYAGKGFIKSEIGQYVNENCDDFGFVIRYPLGKKSITRFSYEPWHIRYTGLPHSKIIMQNSLTLEEYLENLKMDCYYSCGDYIISKQDGDGIIVPEEYDSIVISPDNCGNYIVTIKLK